MSYCRLGLTVVATLGLLIVAKPMPASAGSALALAMMQAGADVASPRLAVHFKKTRSYYCYPRNYWWFYRPYTTAFDGHARCMPYFHYPDSYGGGRSQRYIK
jgi:hypothetical protein